MSELRWILLIFAAVVLAVIYLWGRRSERRAAPEGAMLRARTEPTTVFVPEEDEAFADPVIHEDRRHRVDDVVDDLPAVRIEALDQWRVEETLPLPVEDRRLRSVLSARDSDPALNVTLERETPAETNPRAARIAPTIADDDYAPVEAALEPQLSSDSESSTEQPVLEKPAPAITAATATDRKPQRLERRRIFALRLSAADQKFAGAALRAALDAELLHHGKYGIYHREHIDGSTIFSVADIGEPGSFDLATIDGMTFAGVTLFTQLPGAIACEEAFNAMLACAGRLQQQLGGRLQDERGLQLTSHRAERVRDEVREFERSLIANEAEVAGSSSVGTTF